MEAPKLKRVWGNYELYEDPHVGGFVIRNHRSKRAWGPYPEYEYARSKMDKLAGTNEKRRIRARNR